MKKKSLMDLWILVALTIIPSLTGVLIPPAMGLLGQWHFLFFDARMARSSPGRGYERCDLRAPFGRQPSFSWTGTLSSPGPVR